jgi:hypothetical protein
MKEQFVTYDISLKLKELGFDEPCFGYFNISTKSFYFADNGEYMLSKNLPSIIVSAPLWQQVIDWLKREYSICVTQTPSIVVDSWIVVTSDSKTIFSGSKEQAILNAIGLCKKN